MYAIEASLSLFHYLQREDVNGGLKFIDILENGWEFPGISRNGIISRIDHRYFPQAMVIPFLFPIETLINF